MSESLGKKLYAVDMVRDHPVYCTYFGTYKGQECQFELQDHGTRARIIAIVTGKERTPEGTRNVWKVLPWSEQIVVQIAHP